jgi:hypothetical protein
VFYEKLNSQMKDDSGRYKIEDAVGEESSVKELKEESGELRSPPPPATSPPRRRGRAVRESGELLNLNNS